MTDQLGGLRKQLDIWFSYAIQNRAAIGLRGPAYQEMVDTAALALDMIYNPEGTE